LNYTGTTGDNKTPNILSFVEKTEVFFCELTDDMINAYVATGLPMSVPIQSYSQKHCFGAQ
jgi:predicted house-cleaning NTP pyrophosphatase (Maf/HAM1 superfamily)